MQESRSGGTATPDDRAWSVKAHHDVRKLLVKYGRRSDVFRPTLEALFESLETNPKQYPKKRGDLKGRRAAPITFADDVVWRAVFDLDESSRAVRILSLGPHDQAYDEAKRR